MSELPVSPDDPRALLPLLPRLRVAGPPQWRPTTVLRGLEHLRLEIAA
jgi:hypothetical protein